MPYKLAGTRGSSELVAGSWKFRKSGGLFTVTHVQLVETAKELFRQNPGGGWYTNLLVRGTATDELGISFIYERNNETVEEFIEKTADFFCRHHGKAYKGHDIGPHVTEILIEIEN